MSIYPVVLEVTLGILKFQDDVPWSSSLSFIMDHFNLRICVLQLRNKKKSVSVFSVLFFFSLLINCHPFWVDPLKSLIFLVLCSAFCNSVSIFFFNLLFSFFYFDEPGLYVRISFLVPYKTFCTYFWSSRRGAVVNKSD